MSSTSFTDRLNQRHTTVVSEAATTADPKRLQHAAKQFGEGIGQALNWLTVVMNHQTVAADRNLHRQLAKAMDQLNDLYPLVDQVETLTEAQAEGGDEEAADRPADATYQQVISSVSQFQQALQQLQQTFNQQGDVHPSRQRQLRTVQQLVNVSEGMIESWVTPTALSEQAEHLTLVEELTSHLDEAFGADHTYLHDLETYLLARIDQDERLDEKAKRSLRDRLKSGVRFIKNKLKKATDSVKQDLRKVDMY